MISFRRTGLLATLLLVGGLGLTGLSAPALAQFAPGADAAQTTTEPRDGPPYQISLERHTTLEPDLTSIAVTKVRLKVLREVAIRSLGQQVVNFIDGMQTLDIQEAYTEKSDGRRADVDPANILTRDAASGAQAVYLRDAKVKTIIFPDLQIGDSIVYTTRLVTRERMFPGQFYTQEVFSRAQPFKDIAITLEAPSGLKLFIEKNGTGITQEEASSGDKRVLRFTYTAQSWVQEVPGSVSVLDREPRIFISTFPDYASVGRAYWASAADKTAQTPEIKALAEEITKGVDGRLAQARAIDNWVKRNIRYVAVYLGQGRFVPNTAAAVLKNRYGDCKDQAVLMGTLLEAKGIRSEHALIQLGNSYRLPDVAMPIAVNHVILHLTDLEVWADPTLSNGSFGVLSEVAYDKPVILASATSARLGRTPVLKPEAHTTINRSRIKVAADGTVSGSTEQIATGFWASGIRAFSINLQNVGREKAAENILNGQRTPGKGTIEQAGPYDNSEPVVMKGSFTLTEKLGVPLQGLRRMPFGMPIQSRPSGFLLGQRRTDRTHPFVCYAGRQIDEIDIEFADGLPLPRRITGGINETKQFRFTRNYEVTGRVMKVRREFVSLVPGQVCDPAIEAEITEPMKQIAGILGTQLTFGPEQGKSEPGRTEPGKAESPKSGRK